MMHPHLEQCGSRDCRGYQQTRGAPAQPSDDRGISVATVSVDGGRNYLGLRMKLDAPRRQHPYAECERPGQPVGCDNMCPKVERCPIAASS